MRLDFYESRAFCNLINHCELIYTPFYVRNVYRTWLESQSQASWCTESHQALIIAAFCFSATSVRAANSDLELPKQSICDDFRWEDLWCTVHKHQTCFFQRSSKGIIIVWKDLLEGSLPRTAWNTSATRWRPSFNRQWTDISWCRISILAFFSNGFILFDFTIQKISLVGH